MFHPVTVTGKNCTVDASECDQHVDTTLRLDLPNSSNISGLNKRKRTPINATEGPELALTLAPSYFSISKTSHNENSLVDLDLNSQFHHSGKGANSLEGSVAFKNASVSDLQLSLSAGATASAVTNSSLFSTSSQNNLSSSVSISQLHHADEGSVSCRWKPAIFSVSSFQAKPASNSTFASWAATTSDIPVPSTGTLLSVPCHTPEHSITCTSGSLPHSPRKRNTNTKTCQFQGCGKGARGASGLCIAHGGGRRCERKGCHKGAEGRTPLCKAHGGGRRCEFLGCTKSAEGRTDFCIAHGGGRRCSQQNCTKAARGKSGLCIKHGGGKRCSKPNCTKSAEGYSGLCISHGGGRRCQFPSCTKGAQGSTMLCKAHGGGKRCTAEGCTKGAEGSTAFCKAHGGGKRCSFEGDGKCPKSVHGGTLFCVAHGGGKRCVAPECTKSARGRTNFCVKHGGGKRCAREGCGKSAQGRTDFCKAHGRGNRCSWGHAGSSFGSGQLPCDQVAQGKTGLCTLHSNLFKNQESNNGRGSSLESDASQSWSFSFDTKPLQGAYAVPEGRVHGGRLMSMLASGAPLGQHNNVIGGRSSDQSCIWL